MLHRSMPARIVWPALLGIFLVFTTIRADSPIVVSSANINDIAQHSAIGPAQMRYYAEPGTSIIRILDQSLHETGFLHVVNERGQEIPIFKIAFEDELLIQSSQSADAPVYAVDIATGIATYRYLSRTVLDNDGKSAKVAISSSRAAVDPAYAAWKSERTPSHSLDAVVTSLCNSVVCVQIDEDGDFNFGTAAGQTLLYAYPGDPITSDIRISVDNAVWNLTPEAGTSCDGTAAFVSWNNDGTSIHCFYTIGPLEIEVVHTPVEFSAGVGAILTETFVTNNYSAPLEVGILYQYDTMVDTDDAAVLFYGATQELVEACYTAPFSTSTWDAVPNTGTIVGRGTFSGGAAVTPDFLAFGAWPEYWGTCWYPVCDGNPYGDSAVLYRWNSVPVIPGTVRRVATYYGVGEITTAPGELQLSVVQPNLSCEEFGVLPNPFPLNITVTNTGDSPCTGVSVSLEATAGPGGSAVVLGTNPVVVGTLSPSENAGVSFDIQLIANNAGGCVYFNVLAGSDDCDQNLIEEYCVQIPPCDIEPGMCCLDIVFAVDTTGSMNSAINNIRNELPNIIAAANAASNGDVRLGLVTFGDGVDVHHNLTYDQAAVSASINALSSGFGSEEPESSDEALREIITHDGLCTVMGDFDSEFRTSCEREGQHLVKLIFLITDARPAGCDDDYTPGVDDVNAHARALDALVQGIMITPIYVPTFPDFESTIEPIMLDYAATTGGSYARVNSDGSGTGQAIADIIENCGEPPIVDECGGPNCNGTPIHMGYAFGDEPIEDAVICVTPTGQLRIHWEPVANANFYQVFWGFDLDNPQNWMPMGSPICDTTCQFTSAIGEFDQSVYFHVRSLPAYTTLLGQDIACWPLDEGSGSTTADATGGNNGTIVGADWITGESGTPALHFGVGDYVSLNNDIQFYGQPLQVEACVSIEQYPTISTGSYYIFSCHRYAGWFEGFGLRIDVNGRMLSEVWDQSINNWRTLWAPNLDALRVPLGEPFLVTAVINGPASMILVNSEVVAIGNQPYNSVTNGFGMTIGAHNYNSNRYQYHMRGDIHWLKVSEIGMTE